MGTSEKQNGTAENNKSKDGRAGVEKRRTTSSTSTPSRVASPKARARLATTAGKQDISPESVRIRRAARVDTEEKGTEAKAKEAKAKEAKADPEKDWEKEYPREAAGTAEVHTLQPTAPRKEEEKDGQAKAKAKASSTAWKWQETKAKENGTKEETGGARQRQARSRGWQR